MFQGIPAWAHCKHKPPLHMKAGEELVLDWCSLSDSSLAIAGFENGRGQLAKKKLESLNVLLSKDSNN